MSGKNEETMKYYINIKADTNDADYTSELNEISKEDLDAIRPLIKAISEFKPYKCDAKGHSWTHRHNFPTGDCLRKDLGEKSPEELYVDSGLATQEQLDLFYEFVPSDEYGIHTIKSIEVLEVNNVENLL